MSGLGSPTEVGDLLRRLRIESECARLVHDVADLVDRKQFDEVVALFHEDARFRRPRDPATEMAGRTEILAAFRARPAHEVSRHVVGNLRVSVESEHAATGRFTLVLYASSNADGAPGQPAVLDLPTLIADMEDDYIATEEGWRILARRGRIVLRS